MPSFKSTIKDHQCIIDVIVQAPVDKSSSLDFQTLQKNSFRALVDTGAQKTCISKKLASQLSLLSKGKTSMQSASNIVSVNNCHVDLYIPIRKAIPLINEDKIVEEQQELSLKRHHKLFVSEMPMTTDLFDLLLGMDVLTECTLIFTHGEYVIAY